MLTKSQKQDFVEAGKSQAQKYSTIGVLPLSGIPDRLLQSTRNRLKGDVTFILGRKTLLKRILESNERTKRLVEELGATSRHHGRPSARRLLQRQVRCPRTATRHHHPGRAGHGRRGPRSRISFRVRPGRGDGREPGHRRRTGTGRSTRNGRRAGEFAIGTNVSLSALSGNLLQDEKIPGLHIAFGDPYPAETGADWTSKVHVDAIATGCTIMVDGQALIRRGQFVRNGAMRSR